MRRKERAPGWPLQAAWKLPWPTQKHRRPEETFRIVSAELQPHSSRGPVPTAPSHTHLMTTVSELERESELRKLRPREAE